MKKIISLLTVLCLLSNASYAGPSAATDHTQLIAKTFNQYRYKMTVVADPNNPNYKQDALNEFKKQMVELQQSGVTADEIMNYTRSSHLDAATRADFDRLMDSMRSQNISGEQAGNLAMQFMAGKYQQGASYSGGAAAGYKWAAIIIGVIIIGVVTYYVITNRQDTKTETTTQTNTQTRTDTETETNTETETETETSTVTLTITNTNTVTITQCDYPSFAGCDD